MDTRRILATMLLIEAAVAAVAKTGDTSGGGPGVHECKEASYRRHGCAGDGRLGVIIAAVSFG